MDNFKFDNMTQADRCELFGLLIDVVEDFLEKKGLRLKIFQMMKETVIAMQLYMVQIMMIWQTDFQKF